MEELHLQKLFHLLCHQILLKCPQKKLKLNTSSFHPFDTSIVEGRMRKAGDELPLDKHGWKMTIPLLLANQHWDSPVVNKKVSSEVLKFSRFKKFHRGVNSLSQDGGSAPLGAKEERGWRRSSMNTLFDGNIQKLEVKLPGSGQGRCFSPGVCLSGGAVPRCGWTSLNKGETLQRRAIFISKAAFPP